MGKCCIVQKSCYKSFATAVMVSTSLVYSQGEAICTSRFWNYIILNYISQHQSSKLHDSSELGNDSSVLSIVFSCTCMQLHWSYRCKLGKNLVHVCYSPEEQL